MVMHVFHALWPLLTAGAKTSTAICGSGLFRRQIVFGHLKSHGVITFCLSSDLLVCHGTFTRLLTVHVTAMGVLYMHYKDADRPAGTA